MFAKLTLHTASGVGLLISVLCVAAQSLLRMDLSNGVYYWTTLIAVFGFLFLTSGSDEEEGDSPWWW
jgi:hypothetical protein